MGSSSRTSRIADRYSSAWSNRFVPCVDANEPYIFLITVNLGFTAALDDQSGPEPPDSTSEYGDVLTNILRFYSLPSISILSSNIMYSMKTSVATMFSTFYCEGLINRTLRQYKICIHIRSADAGLEQLSALEQRPLEHLASGELPGQRSTDCWTADQWPALGLPEHLAGSHSQSSSPQTTLTGQPRGHWSSGLQPIWSSS
ncbi:hypothetical protein UY3_00768 [Chelonia mydas]|uniref:Uncharacterized protein n=1 Tax=Chelonia mydas TaxID=8469 RepID=M7C198_CHEMY|nr:hypothetical protein UY3_00768 [Chelonia mydas]